MFGWYLAASGLPWIIGSIVGGAIGGLIKYLINKSKKNSKDDICISDNNTGNDDVSVEDKNRDI